MTVPVIASDRADVYVPDLTKDEFTVYEDGAKQEIEFFAAVRTPFSVVLMLDTSASTQEKLPRIQRAAKTFLEQLQPADRVTAPNCARRLILRSRDRGRSFTTRSNSR